MSKTLSYVLLALLLFLTPVTFLSSTVSAQINPCTDNNPQTTCQATDPENGVYKWLKTSINFLSAIVGVVVVMMIVMGGIQYSTAGSDPKRIAGAKARVYSAILALVFYLFMFSFLQWLVPGGIFSNG